MTATSKYILVLEDNDDRVSAFRNAVETLGRNYELILWRDAPTMIAGCEQHFSRAALISLDHDLNPMPGSKADPGCGLDVAKFLATCRPVCPLIIHSTNAERAHSMHNELRFADWISDRVGPIGNDWIQTLWLNKAREFLSLHENTWPARLPADHAERMQRALLSFEGLSVGDGFGECFFASLDGIGRRLQSQEAPPPPWRVTDDSIMALSILRCLNRYGHIEQDALADAFAREYAIDPLRGYGGTAHGILRAIGQGVPWQIASSRVFDGQGSCGNGGAMRVAPIGAYFYDDYDRVISEARASAAVTHAHPDGQAGGIAIALAAAWVSHESNAKNPSALIPFVLDHLPRSATSEALQKALQVPVEFSSITATSILGNGSGIVASDTVPYCLWCVSKHPTDYPAAMWTTVSAFGDCDTNCAIVGGIVALSAGREGIPQQWLNAREMIRI